MTKSIRLPVLTSRDANVLYKRVLRAAVLPWLKANPDTVFDRALRDWDVPGMLKAADSLVSVVHETASKHFEANQVASLIRKFPFSPLESGCDPEAAALATFLESEERCRLFNTSLRSCGEGYLDRMARYIAYVLGEDPGLSWMDGCDYTGGAAIGVHGNATHLARKLTVDRISCSPAALPLYVAALNRNFTYVQRFTPALGPVRRHTRADPTSVEGEVHLVSCNKLAFVPKTARTHRSIAVEPLGNSYLQKGLDLFMRRKLRRVGLNLSDQSLNQKLARYGSIYGSHATLDLSSASDSISISLCQRVLPPEWFSLMNCIRSPSYTYNGETRRYEKFVTMGNGFCFPLQTLLFSSMVHAVDPSLRAGVDYVVYGDDIVVPSHIVADLSEVLSLCGFILNSKKSHWDGPFRESCGSNWFNGEDVTTMTLDYSLDSIQNMFKFVNLSRRNERSARFLLEARRNVASSIDPRFLFWRPYKGRPETGLDLDPDICIPDFQWNRHLQAPLWKELHSTPVFDGSVRHPDWVVMAGIVRNGDSRFALRRQTRTRIATVSRACDELLDEETRLWSWCSLQQQVR